MQYNQHEKHAEGFINKTIQYISHVIAVCTAFALYIYAAFFYRFAFNYETEIKGQYLAALIAVMALTIIWGLNIFRKKENKVQYVGVIIITLLLLIPAFYDKYSFANEYCTVVLSVLILFACLAFLPAAIIVTLPYFLLVMLLWQLWLAFEQMDGLNFYVNELNVQGSLQNSGIFSCYLVIHLPLLYYVAFHKPVSGHLIKWLKAALFLIIVVFIGFVIYRSQSRSAIIGIAAGIVSLGLFMHWTTLKRWLQHIPARSLIIATCLFLPAAAYAVWHLFFLKKASTFGRVMKWEIAGRHIGDHFFTGTGIGRFSWYYPQWQAHYFATTPHPPQAYYLSAGDSYIIFNEYLQLFETIGLVGFAGFVLLLYWFFRSQSVQYSLLLSALKATMVTLLATGLVTYAIHVNVFLVLLAICFAVAAVISHKPRFMWRGVIPSTLLFILCAYTTFTLYQKWKAAESWNVQLESGAVAAPELNKQLNHDGKFLTEYGQWQLDNGHPKEAVATLEKARQYFISRNTMEALASAYEEAGNYAAAIETRKWLCNFLPNRFVPKYKLLQLYQKTGDTTSAKKMAGIISTMPVKIPSAEVDQIKEAAKNIK